MTYGESKIAIRSWPKTWLPALLMELVKVAIEKEVFLPGGATKIVQQVESKAWLICPFCGHGSYLIDGKIVHHCIKEKASGKGGMDAALNARDEVKTVQCPVCGGPDCVELKDEVDIGVGIQEHVYGYECRTCGQIPVCNYCGGANSHSQWCKLLKVES